ncbi:polysaccharide deacetylase family protein [Escherichia coli]|nr:polysaccharide deacetylase family protein [Escherichia coli]OWR11680.1 polysaccharide deacetylase [Shigella boydii]EGG0910790.1 polysaccharide deacetylase family protein [Escherichia coli]EGK3929187.1 polysaccharide deacetylase family protein [Escherichia coli]EHE2750217.1 polysaccharide deacetylase family protein [Escherichia coli]
MYHYVRPIERSRYPGIKGLELNDFREQIAYLKKNYNPVTIEEVYASFYENHQLPPNAAILTFDDAYLDHFKYAYPILKKNGIQGCFYAPAKTIEEKEILDVNKIHFILASCSDISTLLADTKSLFELFRDGYDVKEFSQYFAELAVENRFDTREVIFLKRFLQVALPEELRWKICLSLFNTHVKVPQEAFCEELYMTKEQLSHMASDGMHIGSHGYNHYWWNKLDQDQLHSELDKSIDFLKSIGAHSENWSACYPYGSASDDVTEILKGKGCKLAFTTAVDVANTKTDNPLLIPRLDTNDLPKISNAKTNKWYQ